MKDTPEVLELLESHPPDVRTALSRLRTLIVETAQGNERIGELQETLKWGQASYLTVRPKTGTTIRIDRDRSEAGDVVLYVNCRSSLVSEWRGLFPQLTYGGDRSVHFKVNTPLPEEELRQMISMALTYHRKRT
ncbi:DUF1801 domain-containing protein [Roseibium sp.]|uniref:DUF1801 domain-containing protein n=1 Tax=Roseibium sp. TaxID=1936156 RepID=UPI0032679C10